MKIYYEGVDIYPSISLNQCVYDSYGEEQADTLKMTFNDTSDQWDTWNPSKGDAIRVVLGSCDTGKMNVISVKPENGLMCLMASSIPDTANDKSNKSWQNVKFKQICQEIAERHGLSCEFYGVEDYTYAYVTQQNKEDFIFLEERCALEGCAFLVYNGRLVVYTESYMESGSARGTLSIGDDVKFTYEDHSSEVYGVCIAKNGAMEGTYSSGVTDKTLNKILSGKVSSQAEITRFAQNLMRYENKKMTSGVCYSDRYLPGYAAGSLITLETSGVPSWNGNVFMTHVRHDMVRATSKLWFRKPLEGY